MLKLNFLNKIKSCSNIKRFYCSCFNKKIESLQNFYKFKASNFSNENFRLNKGESKNFQNIEGQKRKSKFPLVIKRESSFLPNIFQYTNHKDLKKIYYQNEMYHFSSSKINIIVDILDYYVKLNQKNTIKSSEEILSNDSFCNEMIKQIQKFTNDLDNKSILKIFNLNCNLFTKNVAKNESLNKLAFSLTKDINFEKFFKEGLTKFRNVSDLFLHLNNMQSIIKSDKTGDYKISLRETNNFFYFKINLLSKAVLKYIDITKYPTLTLTSLLWVLGKNSIKQIDVFELLIKEITKRERFLNTRNLITICSVIEKFNFYENNKNVVKIMIKKINNLKDSLEKELKSSDISYLFSFVKFMTKYKIFIDENPEGYMLKISDDICKIIDKLCINYLNTETSLDEFNLSLMLKYFFIFQNEKYVQFVIDKIFERFSNILGAPVLNIFSLFFYLNFDEQYSDKQRIFLQQFNQIFYELFEITDLDRHKLNYKEYINIVFCLFQIDYFSTRVKHLTINHKIRNFITSLLNENFLNKIIEDFNESIELLEILNMINIHNHDLFITLKINCESEMNILLKGKLEIYSENEGHEEKAEESLNSPIEENMFEIEDYTKSNFFVLGNLINILLIIKSLDINIEKILINKLLDKLISLHHERNLLSLPQKVFYNNLLLDYIPNIDSLEFAEISKYDYENYFLKHETIIMKFLDQIKLIKTSLYIETNFILDKKFFFDIYIPSLKKAFILNINPGLLQIEKHIFFPNINKEHILYGNLSRLLKTRYGIELFVIHEDLILNQNKEKVKILNQYLEKIIL